MKAAEIQCLEGPNVWSLLRMIEVDVELSALSPSTLAERFERLIRWWNEAEGAVRPSDFPSLAWPLIPTDEPQILALVAINLQRRVHLRVSERFCHRDPSHAGHARLAMEVTEFSVGRRAWELALDLWNATLSNGRFDLSSRLQQLRDFAFDACIGQTTGALLQAAHSRGIPVLRLDDVSLVQLGYGVRQRRLQTAISGQSSFIAESISRDKALTKCLLNQVGLPVPIGRAVVDRDDAWDAAREIGLPVVVKPRAADYGNGVSLKMTTRDEVQCAYERALQHSSEVLVEKHLEGAHHRVLVVGGKVVAAVRFECAVVIGDGNRTVAELIDELNRDPRRGAHDDSSRVWFLMEADQETCRVLALQESSLEHRPSFGQRIVLRLESRIGWGGGVIDVTDDVHSDVAATVIDAVSTVGLDIAGVDLIADNISRPLAEQQGGLLEVNAGPAILMHLQPFSDPPRPVPEAIISHLFPRPYEARIPIVAVCGDDQHSAVVTELGRLLQREYRNVGRATRDGVSVGTRHIHSRPGANLAGARSLLMHPRVDAAVFEVSLDHVRREGLAFDRSQIAVIMGIEIRDEVRTPTPPSLADKLAAVEVVLGTARSTGTTILNLDDSYVMELTGKSQCDSIGFSLSAANPVLRSLQHAGGRCAFIRDEVIILSRGSQEFPLSLLGRVSAMSSTGASSPSVLLATVVVAWALGVPPESLPDFFESEDECAPATSAEHRLQFSRTNSYTNPRDVPSVRQQVT